ncbi:MAG TPA: hypothetical protein VI564_08125 [Candidatus Nanoarchaeia archaeon]|nr:hypothetical protein [Candidatus Nanoarchaeia archaeon]
MRKMSVLLLAGLMAFSGQQITFSQENQPKNKPLLEQTIYREFQRENLYREILKKNGLTDREISYFPREQLRGYADIMDNITPEELRNLAGLVKVTKCGFVQRSPLDYLKIVKSMSNEAFDKLYELGTLKPLCPEQLEGYVFLIQSGMAPVAISRLDYADLDDIVQGTKSGRYGKNLFSVMGTESTANSLRFAEEDCDFDNSADWYREQIRKKIEGKTHLYRTGTDYTEDSSQVEKIKNKHILAIVRRIMDFFDKDSSLEKVERMFPNKSNNYEWGGLMVYDSSEMDLVPVSQFNSDEEAKKASYNPSRWYYLPKIFKYTMSIGMCHTHPIYEKEKPEIYAGPSGYAALSSNYNGDVKCMLNDQERNPYTVNLVITEMPNENNYDLYFRDVEVRNGVPYNTGGLIVLDIGTHQRKHGKMRKLIHALNSIKSSKRER